MMAPVAVMAVSALAVRLVASDDGQRGGFGREESLPAQLARRFAREMAGLYRYGMDIVGWLRRRFWDAGGAVAGGGSATRRIFIATQH